MASMIERVLLALALGVVAGPMALAQQPSGCSACEPDDAREAYRRTIADELERARAEIARVHAARRAQTDPDGAVARALREVEDRLRASESQLRTMLRQQPGVGERKATSRADRAARERGVIVGETPKGYIGVSLSGTVRMEHTSSGMVHLYTEYPVLESVEPGSPAANAGLMAGDVLLAYNGEDVRNRGIALGKLRPGTQLPIRVRRGSNLKDVVVTVGQRPRSFVRAWPEVTMELPDVTMPAIVEPPRPPRPPRTPRAPGAAGAPAVVVAPEGVPGEASPPPLMVMAPFESMPLASPIAGAELTRMSEDLREVFNVDGGVLVLNVAPGTQAERAGLRGGDVIVAIDDRRISRPIELQRAMQRAEKSEVRLEVVRKQKKEQVRRTLTLAW